MTAADTTVRYETLQALALQYELDVRQKQRLFGISPRTQARYKNSNPELNPLVADRLARFQRLTALAVEVFEDEQEGKQWLRSPKTELEELPPVEGRFKSRAFWVTLAAKNRPTNKVGQTGKK